MNSVGGAGAELELDALGDIRFGNWGYDIGAVETGPKPPFVMVCDCEPRVGDAT